VIYTTDAVESQNMSLRKVIKTRGSFPNQEAALKLLHLALEHIAKKWTMPVQNWATALQRFAILLERPSVFVVQRDLKGLFSIALQKQTEWPHVFCHSSLNKYWLFLMQRS
jgi:Transposase, Mutator family